MATPTAGTTTAAPAATAAPTAQNTAAKGAAAAPTPTEIRKLKLKLDGQDVEMPESEVIALAQQGKVAGTRFQEAATMKKQADEIMRFAKENPAEFFKKTGMNAREWAENYLIEQLKAEAMSPEQKKAAANEAKLREYEAEKKRVDAEKLQKEKDAAAQKWHDDYNVLFVEALGKSGLPKTAYTIKRMAELQLTNLKKKLNLNADQLAKLVKEDYIAEQKALFGATEGDALLEMLGPEFVKKLSKAQIAKLKAKGLQVSAGGKAPERKPGEPQMSWREYQRRNRRLP